MDAFLGLTSDVAAEGLAAEISSDIGQDRETTALWLDAIIEFGSTSAPGDFTTHKNEIWSIILDGVSYQHVVGADNELISTIVADLLTKLPATGFVITSPTSSKITIRSSTADKPFSLSLTVAGQRAHAAGGHAAHGTGRLCRLLQQRYRADRSFAYRNDRWE